MTRKKEIEKFHFGPPLELNLQDGVAFVVKKCNVWLAEKSWRDGDGGEEEGELFPSQRDSLAVT